MVKTIDGINRRAISASVLVRICASIFFLVLITTLGFAVAGSGAPGAAYTMSPEPNYELTRDPGDATQLTDGQYSQGYFWRNLKTVGWVESGPIQIKLDLGKNKAPSSICINTARGDFAGVSFPLHADVFVRDNLDNPYSYAGDILEGKDLADGSYQVRKFCSSAFTKIQGRYLLLVLAPGGQYTFLDEIEIEATELKGVSQSIKPLVKLIESNEIADFLKERHTISRERGTLLKQARNVGITLDSRTEADLSQLNKEISKRSLEKLNAISSQPLIIWQKDPWSPFNSSNLPSADDLIEKNPLLPIDIVAQKVSSTTIVLTNNSASPIHVGLSSECPGFTIQLREVKEVLTKKAGPIGDALIPLNVLRLGPAESRQVWISISSRTSESTTFDCKIVATATESPLSRVIPLRIKNWPLELPTNLYVNTWGYLDAGPAKGFEAQGIQDMLSHRVNVFVLKSYQLPWPKKGSTAENLQVDYSGLDKMVKMHKGGEKILFFMFFNHPTWRTLGNNATYGTPAWRALFKAWITDWSTHLAKIGLSPSEFAFYPVDEPATSLDREVLAEAANIIKQIDRRLQIYTTIDSRFPINQLRPLVKDIDIFQVNINCGTCVSVLRPLAKEVWLYSTRGGKHASPLLEYRAQSWRAFQLKVSGVGFWAYGDTGSSGSAWDDFDGRRPDYAVVYESSGGPLSSKRWEAWREGVDDFGILTLAAARTKNKEEQRRLYSGVDEVLRGTDAIRFNHIRQYALTLASRIPASVPYEKPTNYQKY